MEWLADASDRRGAVRGPMAEVPRAGMSGVSGSRRGSAVGVVSLRAGASGTDAPASLGAPEARRASAGR